MRINYSTQKAGVFVGTDPQDDLFSALSFKMKGSTSYGEVFGAATTNYFTFYSLLSSEWKADSGMHTY